MNTNPLRGTYWSWFVFGKATYIDYTSSTPTTTYRAQSRFDWVGDSGMPHPQPSWVEDNLPNGPTIDFIFGELRDWEDVEIYVDGHYLTVTGIKYDTANLLGTLYYVDPLGGKAGKADIAQGDANDPITILYDGKLVTIDVAVSESPIPEPNIILLMSTGILILTGMRRLAIAR
ncbi:PEP-CTERM sorting domain-containing protein [Candidatus Nitrotoga sp. 1052]|uniref:PEP-CTERM sorting domain-containing protein n=1 Tax=Candidatus Nitrotoga sp. 1052 TaxID=2886964 RepID=UPI001EF739CA|nr:PEP-CTERM sorting domain-containing protein [Candidatus Nitrotoga sp. 1052]